LRNSILKSISNKIPLNEKIIVLLGDLGIFQMREAMKNFPSRVINFGIMEQTMIGFCGGLSRGGYYPVLYSITPFLVDRGYEQIKIDLIYNDNPCLILSAGGSFDYSTLGPTHHCQHDISNLLAVNHPFIIHPFTKEEAVHQTDYSIENQIQSYLRISSSELNFPKDQYHNIHNNFDENQLFKNDLYFKKFRLKKDNNKKNLLVIFGPDSQFFKEFEKSLNNSGLIIFMSVISDKSIKLLVSEMLEFEEVLLLIPYEPSGLITKLVRLIKQSEKIPKKILAIHPKNYFFDQSYEKRTIFEDFSDCTKII